MWISIGSRRIRMSPRMRRNIDVYLRKTFLRERRRLGSIIVSVEPARLQGEPGYRCGLVVWCHRHGLVAVSDTGGTIRSAVQQAAHRARAVVRRKIQRQRSRVRRSPVARSEEWLTRTRFA